MTVIQAMNKINKKIPGILPPPPKSEIDGKITNLASKTVPELLELRDRQSKLLSNKFFVSKLADKGAKIQNFYDKILATLREKQEEEKTCCLFSDMNLNPILKEAVQDVEWEGNIGSKPESYLDSDDDSEPEDVMHILSQTTTLEKTIKILKPEKPSITVDDIIKIGDIPHIKYLVDKTESNVQQKPTGHFKPFKTTKSDVHGPEKEVLRKKHKHWEVTAATPPPLLHEPTKLLTLEESLELQKEYNAHLKEVEAQHAREKLILRAGIKIVERPVDTSIFGTYREAETDDTEGSDTEESDTEGSDKEVHDEEPERGGVVFTVMK